MTNLRAYMILTPTEAYAAVASIRDPLPPGITRGACRAIVNAAEAALLRKLNGGTLPAIYTHVKTSGLYRPVVRSLNESDKTPLVTYFGFDGSTVWTRPSEEFDDPDRFRMILNPEV